MTATALEAGDLARIESAADARISPDGATVAYCRLSVDLEGDRNRSEVRLLPAAGGPHRAAAEGRAPRWSPDGAAVAFLRETEEKTELLLLDAEHGGTRVVATLPAPADAPAWSPTGDRIAIATAEPGAGRRIAIVDFETCEAETLAADADAEDIAPSWSPDGGRLAFSRAPREPGPQGPTSHIVIARADGGAQPTAVETDLAFAACPSWCPDGERLACYGTREPRLGLEDPALQAWIVPAEGGTARMAGQGVKGAIAASPPEGPLWSGDGSALFFREARAGDIDVVRADAAGPAEVRRLTGGCQVTSVSVSPDGALLAYSATTPTDPGSVQAQDLASGVERPLAEGSAPRVPETRRRRFMGPRGEPLDGWVQGLQPELAPQPLVVAMHGGPHNFVGSGFTMGHFHRSLLASRGWIVLTLNCSGSGSYGEEFADRVRGHWGGELDLPEYLAAAETLVDEGHADRERLAVVGYSYGGYLAAWAIAHTDRFKAAVIGGPITDLEAFRSGSDIGAWYTAFEMGGEIDAGRARELSPLTHAARIRTPTLVLHGEADDRCPVEQGERLAEAIVQAARTEVQLVRYPGAGHLFFSQGAPSQRIDYNRRVVEWLERHLLGVEHPEPAAAREAG